MIKYNLKCSNNHEFESWFADSSEFEKLNKKRLLECIYCHSKKIKKTIMAPMLSVAKKDKENFKKIDKFLKDVSSDKNDLQEIVLFAEKEDQKLFYPYMPINKFKRGFHAPNPIILKQKSVYLVWEY